MKKFLKNSCTDVSVGLGDAYIIDVFSNIDVKKNIIVWENAHLSYLVVARSSSVDLHIDVKWKDSSCLIFAIFVSDGSPLDAKLISNITSSYTKVEKYIVSLLWDSGKISVDANIEIGEWIKNVSAHLLEENIVFGQNISLKSLPALSVSSHDVKASHGARIEKINQEKLFYLSSKWLSYDSAQKLVVDWYVDSTLSHFKVFSEKELSFIKNFVQL